MKQLRAKQNFTHAGMAIKSGQTFNADSDEEADKLVSEGKAEKVEDQQQPGQQQPR